MWPVVTEVQSKSFALLVTKCHHYNARHFLSTFTTVHVLFFIAECGIMHFLCAMVLCVYSKFGHYLHALGYHCVKFRFCHSLHCWTSPQRKSAYSITHSLTQLIWCPGNQSFSFRTKLTHHNTAESKVYQQSNNLWCVIRCGSLFLWLCYGCSQLITITSNEYRNSPRWHLQSALQAIHKIIILHDKRQIQTTTDSGWCFKQQHISVDTINDTIILISKLLCVSVVCIWIFS